MYVSSTISIEKMRIRLSKLPIPKNLRIKNVVNPIDINKPLLVLENSSEKEKRNAKKRTRKKNIILIV